MRQRESLFPVAWGARRKPGLASPANMSKRGLPARHSVPNQTLSLVNFRLPIGNSIAGSPVRPGAYGARKPGSMGHPKVARRPWPRHSGWRGVGEQMSDTALSIVIPANHRHPSRRRGIQYAAASRSSVGVSGILGHPPSRVTTPECAFAISPHHLREFCHQLPALLFRGRREDRVRAAPAVSCAICALRTRTRAYRYSGSIPAFPAQWLYGLLRALPGERLSCHRCSQEVCFPRT
jgi:hypothetical protein